MDYQLFRYLYFQTEKNNLSAPFGLASSGQQQARPGQGKGHKGKPASLRF